MPSSSVHSSQFLPHYIFDKNDRLLALFMIIGLTGARLYLLLSLLIMEKLYHFVTERTIHLFAIYNITKTILY